MALSQRIFTLVTVVTARATVVAAIASVLGVQAMPL